MRSRHSLEDPKCMSNIEETDKIMNVFRESRKKNGSQWKHSKKTLCKNTNKYQKKTHLN